MSDSTPPLSPTPPLNRTPVINTGPALNAVNLSRRLNTLKRKGNNHNQKEETPVKRPAIASANGPSSSNRRRMYARSKNVNVVWRKNPETGEAEMLKFSKQTGTGKRGRKSRKSRKSRRRH